MRRSPGSSGGRPTSRARPGRHPRAPQGALRTCSSSCSTTPGSATWAASAARSRRPTSTASRKAGCATTTCTRRRCAPRAARASSPAATTIANSMAAITELASGYPGYNGDHAVRERHAVGDAARAGLQHLHGGQVAPDAEQRGDRRRAIHRWPLARGFERFYGFLGGDTSQWYPDLVYDNHQVEPPKTPERGLSPDARTWSTSRSSSSPTRSRSTPTSRSTCTSASAPRMRRTTSPRSGPTATRASSTTAGTRTAERTFARQKELGIIPADAELSRHDPDVPDWATLPADARRLYSRMMEVFAGFLSHTDHHLGRLLDYLQEQGQLDNTIVMVISDNGASAEGGPTGTTNEAQFFNNAQEPIEDSLKRHRRDRGPVALQPLPVGLDVRRQHPLPALEARDLPGRVTATPSSSRGRPASGRKARSETSTRTSSTWCRPCSTCSGIDPPATIRGVTQSPLDGVSFAHTLDDASAPSRHHTQYFEMLGHRAIDHDGWRAVCPWPGPSFAEAGMGFGQPISAERLSQLDATGWELYHVAEDSAENHNLAAEHRDRLVALIAPWYVEAGRNGVLPIDGSALERMVAEKPLVAPTARSLHLSPGYPGGAVLRRSTRPQPPSQHHRDVDIPEGGAEGVLLMPGQRGWRLLVLRQGRSAPVRP